MAEAMNIGDKLQQMADCEGGKRSAEESMTASQNNKRPRGDGTKVSFRLLIQSSNAGGIIGKGGVNINSLRKKYSATVTVPDCSGPERILTVTTDIDSALDCIGDVLPLMEDSKQEEQCSVKMLVHQSLAGAIIGKSGCKIKEMREQIGTQFKVYPDVCPNSTDRVVEVTGLPDKVVNALRELQNLILTTPVKGPSQPYDPYCFDPFFAQNYGGFSGSESKGMGGGGGGRGRGGMGGFRGRGFGGRGGGGGGRGGMGSFDFMGAGASGGAGGAYGAGRGMFAPPMGGMRGGGRGGRGGGGGGVAAGGGMPEPLDISGFNNSGQQEGFQNMGTTKENVKHLTIPKDLAGAIIGSGGCRIRQIRANSGANIKIDDAKPDSNERLITITGSQEQINFGQFLLQQSVRQYSGNKY